MIFWYRRNCPVKQGSRSFGIQTGILGDLQVGSTDRLWVCQFVSLNGLKPPSSGRQGNRNDMSGFWLPWLGFHIITPGVKDSTSNVASLKFSFLPRTLYLEDYKLCTSHDTALHTLNFWFFFYWLLFISRIIHVLLSVKFVINIFLEGLLLRLQHVVWYTDRLV